MVTALREYMMAGEAPTSEPVQALATDWKAMATQAPGHDRDLGQGLRKMLENESEVRRRLGLDDDIWVYMQETFQD